MRATGHRTGNYPCLFDRLSVCWSLIFLQISQNVLTIFSDNSIQFTEMGYCYNWSDWARFVHIGWFQGDTKTLSSDLWNFLVFLIYGTKYLHLSPFWTKFEIWNSHKIQKNENFRNLCIIFWYHLEIYLHGQLSHYLTGSFLKFSKVKLC